MKDDIDTHSCKYSVSKKLVFSGTNFLFSKFSDQGKTECKRYDLTIEQIQRDR